jgi:hypothetical protein
LLPLVAILMLAGCARGCSSSRPPIHLNPNMDSQPKVTAQAESAFFYDGSAMPAPVAGTVARGELVDDTPYYTGKESEDIFVASIPLAIDEELLDRGEERFTIYCAPCHHLRGTGRGILYQKGNVPTPSYREQRLRDVPDGHIFNVITNGTGLMPSYRWPIPVEDRWAIVAHVRRLQEH